ncbi:MAG: cellulase family glycosylhydrolase [Bacteroidaceae bacterium]|nr:cellulase family glycosylhydrolase [Bacteroidaceae bacterium]
MMKLKSILIAMATCMASLTATAQVVGYGLQPLHVDGNHLKDPYGNKVVLHGVMDTPSPYFNNYRWTSWAEGCSDSKIGSCVNYFNKLFTAITDTTQGAYCNLFRLHLDPCWTNGNANSWPVDSRETGEGEGDISHYDGTRLTKYMRLLYFRIAQQAMKNGLYVIMRPPGVCPHNIYVGGSYQKFLIDVWDRVTKNDSILKYSGQIGIELANEPINVYMNDGSSSEKALHDFFQPIVDKIRANGFKGVIWVPGTGYQSNYRDYAKYPITGDQIGYAVHNYAGWYGNSDSSCDPTRAINEFGASVPILRTNPITITEVDWSPQNTNDIKNYNEMGQPVYGNYGTWATASTSKWGKAYKAILDHFGNISMTLTGTGDYIDIDDYINNKKVTPAFKVKMEKNGVDPYEACGVACFDWYEKYAKVDYPSTERYQPIQEIPENPFELSKEWFNPTILYEGTATHNSSMSTLKLKKGGCSGWRFEEEEGIDLSGYNYLIIRLGKNASKNTFFRIYDTANYWAEPYMLNMAGAKEFKIDLHNMQTESGTKVNPSRIRLAGFNSAGADQSLYVYEVFLSVDGENPATEIEAIQQDNGKAVKEHYSIDGRRIPSSQKGIHIVKYKDGSVKKVFVK